VCVIFYSFFYLDFAHFSKNVQRRGNPARSFNVGQRLKKRNNAAIIIPVYDAERRAGARSGEQQMQSTIPSARRYYTF
jgi:hypothetical protein